MNRSFLQLGNDTLAFLTNETITLTRTSLYIYTIFTPLIFFLGIFGNSICIKISISSRVRKQTSSLYLASLSICDILVLLLYVLPEWIAEGLAPILYHHYDVNFIARNIVCQLFLYVCYTLRFMSVWLLVASAIERYIGVCHPLLRLRYCSKSFAQRVIVTIVITSMVICLYRPFLSTVSELKNKQKHCTSTAATFFHSNILDTLYAGMLCVVPSIIILIVSILIARRLLIFRHLVNRLSHKEMMGVQFASFLVLISSGLLLFTWPYYVCWIIRWYYVRIKSEKFETLNSIFDITKSIFYCNYSMNFFLYSLATFYFRSEMKRVFSNSSSQRNASKSIVDINELQINYKTHKAQSQDQPPFGNCGIFPINPNYQNVHQNHTLCNSDKTRLYCLQPFKAIHYH